MITDEQKIVFLKLKGWLNYVDFSPYEWLNPDDLFIYTLDFAYCTATKNISKIDVHEPKDMLQ
jgi:hypothetical protein